MKLLLLLCCVINEIDTKDKLSCGYVLCIVAALMRVTVDGGTNTWLQWLRRNDLQEKLPHPNLITGDLDSCRKESIEFFSDSKVIQTIDQDATDFTKSLRVLQPFIKELKLECVIAICETSGRIDQILANVQTLYLNHRDPHSCVVYILSSQSLSWLLLPGDNEIHIPDHFRDYWCSLVPFQHSTIATTSGLRWNLNETILEFGGIVSTSNKYEFNSTKNVCVSTNKPLLWSMGFSND